MKIVKTALIAIIALGAAVESAKAAQAIHPDYANMNPQQVKRAASQMRQQIAPLMALAPVVPLLNDPVATGTKELIKAAASHNLDDYVAAAKVAIKAATDNYMDNVIMAGGNNNVIRNPVGHAGGLQPADRRRDSFKTALKAAIDAPNVAALAVINPLVVAPASLNLHVLSTTQEVTLRAFGTVVENWIDTLLAADGPFLEGAVPVGAGDQPADRTRDAFKAALVNVIDGINL